MEGIAAQRDFAIARRYLVPLVVKSEKQDDCVLRSSTMTLKQWCQRMRQLFDRCVVFDTGTTVVFSGPNAHVHKKRLIKE